MLAVDAPPSSAGHPQSFSDLAVAVPQLLPEMEVPFCYPKTIHGKIYFSFTVEELEKTAEPFRYSLVLKFLWQRPSLDAIRAFIRCCWRLSNLPIVSAMQRPRHVFVRLSNESDFNKSLSHESCDINGVPYKPFAWRPDFDEFFEPSWVPVWVFH